MTATVTSIHLAPGSRLPTKPGTRMRIGEVDLEVVRIAAPCRLLSSGTIQVGDAVEVDGAAEEPAAG